MQRTLMYIYTYIYKMKVRKAQFHSTMKAAKLFHDPSKNDRIVLNILCYTGDFTVAILKCLLTLSVKSHFKISV